MTDHDSERPSDPRTFSIFSGGPFYRLQEKLGLVRAGQRRLGHSMLYAVVVTWMPMVFFAALQGLAIGPTRAESFLMDFEVNVRFLVSLPVLLLTEAFCEKQLILVVDHFLRRGVVAQTERGRFEMLIRDITRLSHSRRAEGVLLGLAYLQCLAPIVFFLELPEATWRLFGRDGHYTLSLAGGWYFVVAFPFFAFLFWRWLWRLGLWWRFMWQTSSMELQVTAAHRDGAGGLGFLSQSLGAFAGFAFAMTAMVASSFADYIIYEGQSPLEYKWVFGGVVAFLLILIVGPVFLFARQLYKAKEHAKYSYGELASHQLKHVEGKWLSNGAWQDEAKDDFRAVTHLGSTVTAVHNMGILPLYKDDVFVLLLVTLLPFLPLLLTMVPVEEVLPLLLKTLA